jgi:hypothetical protein
MRAEPGCVVTYDPSNSSPSVLKEAAPYRKQAAER